MKNKNYTFLLGNITLVNDTFQLKLNINTEVYVHDYLKLNLVKMM